MEAALDHNETLERLADRRTHRAWPDGDAEFGNFLLIHFPARAGKGAKEADAFLTGAGLCCARSGPTACPTRCA
jgi:hypothetical protein